MIRLIVLITALLLTACGGGGSKDGGSSQLSGDCSLRITNGSQCSTGSGPVVLLELLDSGRNLVATCTGAFISTQHVLTGAHCFGDGVSSATIRFGDQRIDSQSINIPREYQSTSGISPHDFAVVTLSSAAESVEVLPIVTSKIVTFGTLLNIIGYGQDENGNSALQGADYEESLKKGTMVVSDLDSGLRAFAAEYNETGQSVCSGDSGGPAIVLNDDGIAGIAGVAQAVADPSTDGAPVCLTDTVAVFTSMQDGNNLAFIRAIVPAVGVI